MAVLTLAAAGLVFGPPVEAAQASAVTIEARVGGNKIELWLVDISEPIGALEFTIAGLSPLDGDCEVTGGFGACSDQQGDLLVVAVNPTGFTAAAELANAKVDETIDIAGVAINVVQAADVAGQPIEADTSVILNPDSSSSIPPTIWIALPLIVVAAALLGRRAMAAGNKTPQDDG